MKIRVKETGYVFEGYLDEFGHYRDKYNIFNLNESEIEVVPENEEYAAIWITCNKGWKPVPDVGKEYICYDDGKIKESRQYKVQILLVVSYEDVCNWDKEAFLNSYFPNNEENHYLFESNPDYFIYAITYELKNRPMIEIFSRTRDGGWFGIGEVKYDEHKDKYFCDSYWCSGILDIDGTITEQMYKDMQEFNEWWDRMHSNKKV